MTPDFRCEIHAELAGKNYKGCLAYDCFGAGQKATQICLPSGTWKTGPEQAGKIFQTFTAVFELQQMLWYLIEAASLISDECLQATIDALICENEQMTRLPAEEIAQLDMQAYRRKVNALLKQVSSAVSFNPYGEIHRENHFGKDFRKAMLDGRDFSMSLMIAANFEGCSLKGTNFLGADIRGANLKNADLSESIFLTQMQINSAKGNSNTRISEKLSRPITWEG